MEKYLETKPFLADYAKNSVSVCRTCNLNICNGELRLVLISHTVHKWTLGLISSFSFSRQADGSTAGLRRSFIIFNAFLSFSTIQSLLWTLSTLIG